MLRLKADLHTHCADDPCDSVSYSAEMLIDAVAKLNINVLAITCHKRVSYNARLAEYARQRGVLLIPAVELDIEKKHVLVLNPDEEQAAAASFADLRRVGRRHAAVVAPHAFYRFGNCLGRKLAENADLFDAVEYSGVYLRWINPNGAAVSFARAHRLPLLGNSDTHALPYCGRTYSWIEVEESSIDGVIDAIRKGRVTIETQPRPLFSVLRMALYVVRDQLKTHLGPLF